MSFTFFGKKITMLVAPLIDCSPHLCNTENICYLHSLLASIETIVDTILSRWAANIPIFLTIAIAFVQKNELLKPKEDQRDMAFLSLKRICPVSGRMIIRTAMRLYVKTTRSHSRKKSVEGYKVISKT